VCQTRGEMLVTCVCVGASCRAILSRKERNCHGLSSFCVNIFTAVCTCLDTLTACFAIEIYSLKGTY
jgi:hypothetical protein